MKNTADHAPPETDLTLRRYTAICARMLLIAVQTRAQAVAAFFAGAVLEIGGMLISIFATARLGSLLAGYLTTGQSSGIWLWLWVDIFAAVMTAVGFFIMAYARRLLYFGFVRWSTNTFMATLCTIDLPDYYDDHIRNKINKVSGAYTWTLPQLSETLLELIYGVLRFIAITILVAQITWWLVPLIAVFLVPTLIAENRLAKVQWFVWDDKGDQRHVFWGLDWILRQAKGQMELRSTQASKYVLQKIDGLNETFYDAQESKYRQASRLLLPTRIVEVAGTAIGAVTLLSQFLSRAISLERYFFLSGALLRIGGALNNIFGTLSRMQDSLLFADSYFTLVDSTPQIVDTHNAKQLTKKVVPSIEFRDVTFSYPGQSEVVFKNLNLTISAGEHVALVGENGAGKSTIIKLLLRLYRPISGQILVNGISLSELTIESWYEQIATLFQDFNQYPLSVLENIQIGRSDQPLDNRLLREAAEFGGVDQMIAKYPYGWDTVLDSSFKKGVEPSGGQWQRVALARAFYRNASVLILDEPTAAIDAKAEYDIFNNIFEHYKGKTTIIVSHRFSTVRRADRIIVLDQGKIIETGSHESLMKKKGLYHEMFSKQAEGYK